MKLSFIIPALNEYKHLPRTLEAVHTAMAGHTGYEIILCDNGSSDGTPELARERGCKVLQAPGATIARLRNLGVAASDGDLLIFIDSDVSLAPDWFTVLQKVCSSADNNTITGSKCLPPADVKAFIVSNWFALLPDSNQNYINSGHLIVPRQVHDRIGGFDESLRTGEDYDYCQRARQQGVNIRVQPELRAYHYGFPLRIRDFIAREAWHGRHDVASVRAFLDSRTAQAALANTACVFAIPASMALQASLWLPSALLLGALFWPLLLTRVKFRNLGFIQTLRTSVCFELYLWGRTLSLLKGRRRPKARCQAPGL